MMYDVILEGSKKGLRNAPLNSLAFKHSAQSITKNDVSRCRLRAVYEENGSVMLISRGTVSSSVPKCSSSLFVKRNDDHVPCRAPVLAVCGMLKRPSSRLSVLLADILFPCFDNKYNVVEEGSELLLILCDSGLPK